MRNMCEAIISYTLLVLISATISSNITVSRSKRWLVYPYGGQAKVVIGIAWPIVLGSKQSMSCSVNLQFQFPEPTNITQLHNFPPIISGKKRKKRSRVSDRMMAYLGVEQMLNRHGMDGHNCLLRSICENAMDPIDHKDNGILGELLHIFLSPDYGDGEVDHDLDVVYEDAQNAGYYGVDCFSLYPNCPNGRAVLDFISAYL